MRVIMHKVRGVGRASTVVQSLVKVGPSTPDRNPLNEHASTPRQHLLCRRARVGENSAQIANLRKIVMFSQFQLTYRGELTQRTSVPLQ